VFDTGVIVGVGSGVSITGGGAVWIVVVGDGAVVLKLKPGVPVWADPTGEVDGKVGTGAGATGGVVTGVASSIDGGGVPTGSGVAGAVA
jgi:hypothetical protein